MTRTTTSLRMDDELRHKLSVAAKREGMTVSALIERYAREGLVMEEHNGIIFNSGPAGRRAAVMGAADVWEIVSDLRRFEGSDEERVAALAEELGWQKWKFDVALKYYAKHKPEVDEWIRENDRLWEEQQKLEAERKQLFR